MSALPPALVLGVDTPIGLTVIRELGEHGVPVHAIGGYGSIGAASRYTRSFTERGQGPLANWLPESIREIGARCLFAISESDLLELADLPEEIEGCRILTPRASPLAMVLDKSRTLEAARAVGIATPEVWQPQTANDVCPLPFPLIVKWADPAAVAPALAAAGLPLIKAERIDTSSEYREMMARYAPLSRWPLLQSFAPGTGLGQMLHMADGASTLMFQHRRLHEWPVAGGTSTLCESVPLSEHQAQMALSERLLAGIGWEGPAMVEYRHDPAAGRFVLMEVNGRFWGSLPLAHGCGAHFAWEQYRTALDLPPRPMQLKPRRACFAIPETRRLLHILRHGGGEGRFGALVSYAFNLIDSRVRYYIWDWRDPMPFFRDLANVIRKAMRGGTPSQGS